MRHILGLVAVALLSSSPLFAADTGRVSSDNSSFTNTDAFFYPKNQYASDPKLSAVAQCMRILQVSYIDYQGNERSGQVVVNKDAADDIKKAFQFMKQIGYPIKSVQPVNNFGWSDDRSMAADNTSAYNFRTIKNSANLSNHAFGFAIDINPLCNPDIRGNGKLDPPMAVYPSNQPCAMEGPLGQKVQAYFKSMGWCWGGNYTSHRDLQHFEKLPPGQSDCASWSRAGALRNSNGPYCN